MFELIGLIFGGVSRLAQHWLDLKDKQAERTHELAMFEHQIALADKRYAHDADIRRMDAMAEETRGDFDALRAALESQAREAQSAGGWVAKLSASVRPVIAYWFAAVYTVAKLAGLYLALQGGAPFMETIRATYTEFDGVIFSSVLAFYFADRSLRRGK